MEVQPRLGEPAILAAGVLSAVSDAAWRPEDSMDHIKDRLTTFCARVHALMNGHEGEVMASSALLGAFGRMAAIQKSVVKNHPARHPRDRWLGDPEHLNQIRRALPTFAGYLREIEAEILREFPELATRDSR